MAEGWIRLHRQIQEHWLWEGRFDKAHAWVDLLMLANHEDVKTVYKGEIITCKRGDVNRSIKWLAERWGWSRKGVKGFLDTLEKDGMVTTMVTTNRTVITLVNWELYQCDAPKRNTKGNNKSSNEGISEGVSEGVSEGSNEGNTNNNDNNDKNDKNEKNIKREIKERNVIPPTVEMVKAYCESRNNNIDPQEFCDFYTSKGWMIGKDKMKDWQASVRTWEKSRKENTTNDTMAGVSRADEEQRNAEIDKYLESDEFRNADRNLPFM